MYKLTAPLDLYKLYKLTAPLDSIAERLLLTQHGGAHHIECARPRIVYGAVQRL